jgi:hypothetical protein
MSEHARAAAVTCGPQGAPHAVDCAAAACMDGMHAADAGMQESIPNEKPHLLIDPRWTAIETTAEVPQRGVEQALDWKHGGVSPALCPEAANSATCTAPERGGEAVRHACGAVCHACGAAVPRDYAGPQAAVCVPRHLGESGAVLESALEALAALRAVHESDGGMHFEFLMPPSELTEVRCSPHSPPAPLGPSSSLPLCNSRTCILLLLHAMHAMCVPASCSCLVQ